MNLPVLTREESLWLARETPHEQRWQAFCAQIEVAVQAACRIMSGRALAWHFCAMQGAPQKRGEVPEWSLPDSFCRVWRSALLGAGQPARAVLDLHAGSAALSSLPMPDFPRALATSWLTVYGDHLPAQLPALGLRASLDGTPLGDLHLHWPASPQAMHTWAESRLTGGA
jgi:hypothetical protein